MQALQLINQQVGRFAREKVIAFRVHGAENFIFRKSIFNSKISLYFFEMKTCKSEAKHVLFCLVPNNCEVTRRCSNKQITNVTSQ